MSGERKWAEAAGAATDTGEGGAGASRSAEFTPAALMANAGSYND